jgi:DNA-binding Lrp family transcriptional regulator
MTGMPEIVELDDKDRRILWLLSIDARMSYAELAKKARVSKEVANYRVRRLAEEGILRGYYALIDPSCLGLMQARVWMKFQHVSPKIEKEIVEYYAGLKSTGWTAGRRGRFDFGTSFWGRDTNELYNTEKDIIGKFKGYLREFEVGIYARQHFFDRKYLVGKKESSLHKTINDSQKEYLDATEMKMLRLLASEGRMPVAELAKKVGESVYFAGSKLRRLRRNTIKTFLPLIDLNRIGYERHKVAVYLEDFSAMDRLLAFCSSHPNVTSACEFLAGGAGLEIDVEVGSYSELEALSDSMMAQFSKEIAYCDYAQFTKDYKIAFMPVGFSDASSVYRIHE